MTVDPADALRPVVSQLADWTDRSTASARLLMVQQEAMDRILKQHLAQQTVLLSLIANLLSIIEGVVNSGQAEIRFPSGSDGEAPGNAGEGAGVGADDDPAVSGNAEKRSFGHMVRRYVETLLEKGGCIEGTVICSKCGGENPRERITCMWCRRSLPD